MISGQMDGGTIGLYRILEMLSGFCWWFVGNTWCCMAKVDQVIKDVGIRVDR